MLIMEPLHTNGWEWWGVCEIIVVMCHKYILTYLCKYEIYIRERLYQFLRTNTNFIAWETRIRMHSVGCPFDCLWSLQKIFAACSDVKLHIGTGRIFEKLRGHIWKGNQLFSLFQAQVSFFVRILAWQLAVCDMFVWRAVFCAWRLVRLLVD